jgi:hypothetical protein
LRKSQLAVQVRKTSVVTAALDYFPPPLMEQFKVPAEIKTCKAIADDKERLRCFDGLFGATPEPEKSEEGKQANWSIEETKSPTDGTPQVIAANLVGNTVLILRCKEQTTEAAFLDAVQLPRL